MIVSFWFSCSSYPGNFLPDEQWVPLLVHDDAGRAHEHSAVLRLHQVVFSHGHPVLPATAACWQRGGFKAVMYVTSDLKCYISRYQKTTTSRRPTMLSVIANICACLCQCSCSWQCSLSWIAVGPPLFLTWCSEQRWGPTGWRSECLHRCVSIRPLCCTGGKSTAYTWTQPRVLPY